MFRTHKTKPVQKTVQALALLLIFSITACATWDGNRYGKGGRKRQGKITRKYPVRKDVKRPDEKQFASINSPARKASMDMVATGKKHLVNGKLDKALGVFQEAVIIDSTNGIAYYFLAKTRFNLNQFEEALGILDKAESLLTGTDEWMEAISLLRNQIQESYLTSRESVTEE